MIPGTYAVKPRWNAVWRGADERSTSNTNGVLSRQSWFPRLSVVRLVGWARQLIACSWWRAVHMKLVVSYKSFVVPPSLGLELGDSGPKPGKRCWTTCLVAILYQTRDSRHLGHTVRRDARPTRHKRGARLMASRLPGLANEEGWLLESGDVARMAGEAEVTELTAADV